MTSDEIKGMNVDSLVRLRKLVQLSGDTFSYHESIEIEKLNVLFELSFQLAKLNEHFEKVDNVVFGGSSEKKEKV